MAKQKYYAVVAGRTPGLYDQWFGDGGAEAQVRGLPGAVYKSFQSRSEAEAWYREKAGRAPATIAISRADEPESDLQLVELEADISDRRPVLGRVQRRLQGERGLTDTRPAHEHVHPGPQAAA